MKPGQKTPVILQLDSLSGGAHAMHAAQLSHGQTMVASGIQQPRLRLPLRNPFTAPSIPVLATPPGPCAGSHRGLTMANFVRLYIANEWHIKVGCMPSSVLWTLNEGALCAAIPKVPSPNTSY